VNYLPALALTCDPPDFSLLSSQDYRREPPVPGRISFESCLSSCYMDHVFHISNPFSRTLSSGRVFHCLEVPWCVLSSVC
jgi:hypothetical protein